MNNLLTDSFVTSGNQSSKEDDIEQGKRVKMSTIDLGMDDFFKQVEEIEKLMEKLSQQLQKLQVHGIILPEQLVENISTLNAKEESRSATKASAMKAIKQRMEADVDEVGKIVRSIKVKLEEIDKENLTNRRRPGCVKGTSVDRSRMAMTASLKKKLKDRMDHFQTLRQAIQDEHKETVGRRVFTVTGTRPDEEVIDRLIEIGNSEQIFQKAIQEMGRGQTIDALEEIQEWHDAMKEIEKKLLHLHQVFMDMAVLVETQGEILDNIECQVINAVEHVQSGNEALHTAKNLQKKSRKCMMISIAVLLIIAIIIVLSVLKPWK